MACYEGMAGEILRTPIISIGGIIAGIIIQWTSAWKIFFIGRAEGRFNK